MEAIQKAVNFATGGLDYIFPKKGEVETVIIKEIEKISSPMPGTVFVRIAGLAGATAVTMAAYGAHAFQQNDEEDNLRAKTIFESGNKMHIMHSIALLGVPMTRRPKLVGSVMVTGLAIFSGTCYYNALTGDTRVRRFTPYGGMLLILSWLLMIL